MDISTAIQTCLSQVVPEITGQQLEDLTMSLIDVYSSFRPTQRCVPIINQSPDDLTITINGAISNGERVISLNITQKKVEGTSMNQFSGVLILTT